MTEEQRYLFDLNGYVVIQDVLTKDELARAHEAIDAQNLPPPKPEDGSPRFGGLLEWEEPLFRELIDHPKVLPYLKEILGDGLRLDHEYGIYTRKTEVGLGLHGGGTPYDPAQYYHFQNDRIYCGLTVASYAFTDVNPGDGAFCCIPGSHKSQVRLPASLRTLDLTKSDLLRQVPQPAGSVLIFTEALTHGTLPWRSERERRSVLYKYCPGYMAWGHRQRSQALLDRLTENQRRLLEPPYVYRRTPVETPAR